MLGWLGNGGYGNAHFKGDHGDMHIIIIMGMEFGYWFKTFSTKRIRGTLAFVYLVV
jgi:hypothetical protein